MHKINTTERRKIMDKKMFEEFKETLSEYVDTPAEEITEDSKLIEDLGMNSFQFMSLLGDLEEQYDVVVDETEVNNIQTVGEACEYFEKLTK